MITHELTEEFINKHYFVLDTSLFVTGCDENNIPTKENIELEIGTEWEIITDDYYFDGDIYLDCLGSNVRLNLPIEIFKESFSAEEWLYQLCIDEEI